AVALGNSVWVPMLLLTSGVILATTPSVAKRFGAGEHERIGPVVRQALWMGLGIGTLSAILMWNAEPLLHLLKVETNLIEPSMGYLRAVACGFPAMAVYLVLRSYSDGLGHSRPSMVIGLLGLTLNIPLNYIFIFGKLGVPAMGGVGCGWASAVVMLFMALAMLFWVRRAEYYQPSRLFERFDRPSWPELSHLLAV